MVDLLSPWTWPMCARCGVRVSGMSFQRVGVTRTVLISMRCHGEEETVELKDTGVQGEDERAIDEVLARPLAFRSTEGLRCTTCDTEQPEGEYVHGTLVYCAWCGHELRVPEGLGDGGKHA